MKFQKTIIFLSSAITIASLSTATYFIASSSNSSNANSGEVNLYNDSVQNTVSNETYLNQIIDTLFSKEIPSNADIDESVLSTGKSIYLNRQNSRFNLFAQEQQVSLALYNATVYYREIYPYANLIPSISTVDNQDAATTFYKTIQSNWYRLLNDFDKLKFVGFASAVNNLPTTNFLEEQAQKYGWTYQPKTKQIIDFYQIDSDNETYKATNYYFKYQDYSIIKLSLYISKTTGTYNFYDASVNNFTRSSYSINLEPQIFRVFKDDKQVDVDIKNIADDLEELNLYNESKTEDEKIEIKNQLATKYGDVISYVLVGIDNE